MRLWSFSTTVRNPERILPFLKVFKLLEGKPFNKENQELFQILLIKYRHYKPSNIPLKYKEIFDDPLNEIPLEVAKEVFYLQNYNDPPHRGRESANPLTKLGFCIARETEGEIVITDLGNRFINGDYEIGYAFFKSLLKLQFPNPWSAHFSKRNGFDVVPFIASMHLIKSVNEHSEKKGLTRNEFCLFVPSLINFQMIELYVEKVLKYRKHKNKNKFIQSFAKEFYQTKVPTEKQISNFFEYGDNIMRYFRLTRYYKVTTDSFGADYRVDIEPTREVEINQLLKQFNGKALEFDSPEEYLNYISDISLPQLPSEDINNSLQIANSLINQIRSFLESEKISISDEENKVLNTNLSNCNLDDLVKHIKELRRINLDIKDRKSKLLMMNNDIIISNIITLLKDKKAIKKISPEKFEKLLADSLKIINDEIKIKPNYPVDDNGEPISHAAGGQPDIECFYKTYNAICEVTLDTSNFQWVRESQPVMRHLREFENKYEYINNYCIFVSPKVHEDTLYHFWTSIKHGYNGARQKIIPLTTEQFSILLETLLVLLKQGKRYNHNDIEMLYKNILEITNNITGHIEWLYSIDQVLIDWKNKISA